MHKALDMKFFYSTTYHPQTNGSSEHTNQTAEIMLQFYLYTMNQPEDWPKVLPRIQSLINNTKSAVITKTSNKIALGFTFNWPLDLLSGSIGLSHKMAQIEAKDTISFAQINYKHYYDWFYQSMNLKVNNFALLRLHKGYSILSTLAITKKLT